ncbi:MAG: hypothetical protein LBD81_02435 [Holosporaceae bacterium]|nr:hypothetical protein [Holosporaceae bacterium]
MKKATIYFISMVIAAVIGGGVQTVSSSESDETVSEVVLGLSSKDLEPHLKAIKSAADVLSNIKSKASSSGTSILKYSTDTKSYSENTTDVAIAQLVSFFIKLSSEFFDSSSMGISLTYNGLNSLKKAGKKVGGKDHIAAQKQLNHGLELLESQKAYFMMINFCMYVISQYISSKSKPVIRCKDIKKELDTLCQLTEDKKKLIGSQTGLTNAMTGLSSSIDELASDASDSDVSAALTIAKGKIEYTTASIEKIIEFWEMLNGAMDTDGPSVVADELKAFGSKCKHGATGKLTAETEKSSAKSTKKKK